ncbi:MAG: phosphate signaling complex protein PhoU [Verrucomicrobiales bacterium]|nr:phosphate signaling complex protein PhoU [Verrucomicrobiales bacterium]
MSEYSHRLGNFDAALREARDSILRMASIAEQNLESAIRGLLTRNAEFCNTAIVEDDEVNFLERKIDADSFEILMRYNPVASDLREVIAGMKVANNLERVSDEAQNIARRARKILKHPEIKAAALIEPLYEKALSILQDGMRSYAEGDNDLAISLYERDRALDMAHNDVIRELTKQMDSDSIRVKSYLHLIFIVRSLERVGDHAVNIAEDGIFLESATDVRHLGPKRAAAEIEAHI